MSNYPPGMSGRDFVRAGIDQPHHHEHEWVPCEGENPVFEDGAAIFLEECLYAEGEYGQGWECEEGRQGRCDVERVVKLRDGKPDIVYLASEDKPRERFGVIERIYEDALVAIEMTDYYEIQVLDIDPPSGRRGGHVRVRVGDKYEVVYE